MGSITAIGQALSLLIPLIMRILESLREKETQTLIAELKNAKTGEEKQNAAKKIADHLYRT